MDYEFKTIRLFEGKMYSQKEMADIIEELDKRTRFNKMNSGNLIAEVINGAIIFKAQNENGVLEIESVPDIEKISENTYKLTIGNSIGSNGDLDMNLG